MSSLTARARVAIVAALLTSASASGQDHPPAPDPPVAAPIVTAEAKVVITAMQAAMDRAVDRGLKSMTGVLQGSWSGGRGAYEVTFVAPGIVKAEVKGRKGRSDWSVEAVLRLTLIGLAPLEEEQQSAEVTKKDGKDVLVLTNHLGDETRRSEYEFDVRGLPVRASVAVKAPQHAARAPATFAWTKVGDRYRLSTATSEVPPYPWTASEFVYEEFAGIPIATSWKFETTSGITRSLQVGKETFEYRFTELTVNGQKVDLQKAKDAPKVGK